MQTLRTFQIMVCVRYKELRYFDMSDGNLSPAAGYFRNYVVRARSEDEVRELVANDITDGEIDWDDSELAESSASIECSSQAMLTQSRIVFRSSHLLYPPKGSPESTKIH